LLLIALAGSAHAKLRESAKGMRLEDFVDSSFAKKSTTKDCSIDYTSVSFARALSRRKA
jgi:hypothetical protein